ncbi:hypothetical protein [Mycobacterium sp. 155]|uniref:hypothetical protein n=1 Tax=Mycobacterium sp. 155 TaxID=1157943 RepID=UPI0003664C0A|nr:hypothetical protein [Mycobacterium sp. 155]
MNVRRVAALKARADHPSTPEAEAQACRELLARMVPECGCSFCALVATDPVARERWQAIRADPRTQVLCCGAWITTA